MTSPCRETEMRRMLKRRKSFNRYTVEPFNRQPLSTAQRFNDSTVDRQPAIRVVMMPRDANYLGTIFGGVILSSLDLAGAMAAMQHSERRLVTAAMREVKFIAPVFVGDLVSFYTETVKIGRSSITIRVTVEAKRAKAPHETVRVTQAEVVYVAIDEKGRPASIRS
jgi:acyl-CoA thioesterase YciA